MRHSVAGHPEVAGQPHVLGESCSAGKPQPHEGWRSRHRAPRLVAVLVALVFLSIATGARAANDPDLDWWTIETAHFRIHYEKNLEPVAERLARVSEEIHDRISGPMNHSPDARTEVLITDVTDGSNGSATAIPQNIIRLFVTSPGDLSSLGDYDDWQLGLQTHEYTHILHTDNISGVPSIINAVLGKTLVPNQLQPRWILEGLAVVFESAYSSAGRIRSSLFDMFLRADYLDDNLAGLAQMSSSPRRYPGGTIYYLYGGRFLQWIADVYGQDVFRAVSTDYGAGIIPFGINRAIKRQTGRTYVELYAGFEAHLKRIYDKQLRAVKRRGLREGQRITWHGREVLYPRFVPAAGRRAGSAYQLVYFRGDDHNRAGQYWLDLGQKRGEGDRYDEELLARVAGGPGPAAFSPEGELVFSSTVPYKRIYSRPDLFALPKGETASNGHERHRRRLTVGLRAKEPTLSPDGRRVAFTRNDRGTTSLLCAERDDDGALEKVKTLVRGQPFDQIYTPVFSPDGSKIAYSMWQKGGFRDVQILDAKTGHVRHVTHDRAIDANPVWSGDGTKLYFSSDRGGIFNVYEYRLADSRLLQVTNVRSGALMPAVSDDGRWLVYSGYLSTGYELFAMRLDESRFLQPLAPPTNRPDAYPEAPPVKMKKQRYNPLPTLRPYAYSFEYAPGNFGDNALTLTASGADIVGNHSFGAAVVADPNAPAPQVALSYAYGRLPVDLGVSFSSRFAPRTDFRFNDQEVEYIEESYNFRSSISYNHPGEFTNQGVSLSYTASILDSDLPIASVEPLDPYASPTVEPLRGFLPQLSLAYSFSNVESSFYTLGQVRGTNLRLSLDLADDFLGSEESFYQARYNLVTYVPLPWGYQTLALRSAGGMSAGTFARRGTFFVGGYNLENTTLLDQVTGGALNGAFVLRGYEPSVYRGSSFLLNSAEYRVPIADIDQGVQTVPVYLRRVGANFFIDYGGAFDEFDFDAVTFFDKGAIINSPQLHTGIGAELWIDMALGYGLTTLFRLGYAYGTSAEAIPGGQPYFIAAGSF